MPNKKLNDRTYLKNTKEEKAAWRRAAKLDAAKNLSEWIRVSLNMEANYSPNV